MGDNNWATCMCCQQEVFIKTRPLEDGVCCECRCIKIDPTSEVMSSSVVRCPYCQNIQVVCNDDGHGCSEGKHEEHCVNCERPFEFETTISVDYTSPPVIEKKDN